MPVPTYLHIVPTYVIVVVERTSWNVLERLAGMVRVLYCTFKFCLSSDLGVVVFCLQLRLCCVSLHYPLIALGVRNVQVGTVSRFVCPQLCAVPVCLRICFCVEYQTNMSGESAVTW